MFAYFSTNNISPKAGKVVINYEGEKLLIVDLGLLIGQIPMPCGKKHKKGKKKPKK